MVRDVRTLKDGLGDKPVVMGILNVTPDSFSDGGQWDDPDKACVHALEMIAEGAEIIDIGPESTRPGARAVPDAEQIQRCVPVIEAIRRANRDACISIDVRRAEVARAALDAGADWINDVSAMTDDPTLAELAGSRDVPVVLMHMQGTPETMQNKPQYEDVVSEVAAYLMDRARVVEEAGVSREKIILDPGIGFGKTVEQNLLLLRELPRLVKLGYPVLVGVSRKSTIGAVLEKPDPADRLNGSLACAAISVMNGAAILRVHDVRETVEVMKMAAAIRG